MIKYALLGIIQGATEFLPVSSSAHLVILQHILGITKDQVAITVILHMGTGLALVVFFFKDIMELLNNLKLLTLLALVTLITAIIGFWGKDFFETLFGLPKPASIALIVTGIILLVTSQYMKGRKDDLTLKDAIILGFTQSIAIIPGISRSGITISTLLFRKITPEKSFRFSFLAAIPVIFGAALLEAKNIGFAIKSDIKSLVAGFLFSFLTGIISLKILRILLKKAQLYYFGYYCIIIGIIALIFVK